VVVRVYVEKKPRKKGSSSIQHQHQLHGPISMGCGRRAGLLSYSHLLRQSAKGALSAPSFSKWVANNNLQPPTQVTHSIYTASSSSEIYEQVTYHHHHHHQPCQIIHVFRFTGIELLYNLL